MTETTNLHLPQFAATDRIHHDDFNDAFQAIDTAIANGVKIATGSYVGTGECGTDKPITLTFSFSPKLVFVIADGANFIISEAWVANFAILLRGVTSYCGRYASNSSSGTNYTVQWGDKTVSWCAANTSCCPEGQLNVSGRTYHYLAVG